VTAGRPERIEVDTRLQRLRRTQTLGKLIGEAPAFVQAISPLPMIARCSAPALLMGETGTGKELVARAIHYLSDRESKPFVPVNCGSLPDTLLEGELFGHERGAYTDARDRRVGLIAQAEGGTLFLDEVDSLTPRAQVAVLRVIQDNLVRPLGSSVEQRVDVRFIAATNLDLAELVQQRTFREDLYYRLCVMVVGLPPLRERRADILLLARHFLQKHALRDRVTPRLAPETEVAMLRHDWPGNVRELENAIIRGINLAEYDQITPFDVGLPGERNEAPLPESRQRSFQEAKKDVVASFERQYLTRLLSDHRGNVSHAARSAGKERRELGRLLKKHRINPQDFLSSV
jgi:DNA-binding NtrC family response regulator